MPKKKNLRNFKKTKRLVKEKKPSRFSLPTEVKRWLGSAALVLGAVVVSLSFFNKAGMVGEALTEIFETIVGKAFFFLPLALIAGAVAFLNTKIKKMVWPVFFTQALLILGIAGLMGSFGTEAKEGGEVGHFISLPLLSLFGGVVSKIFFSAAILVSLAIFWHLSGRPNILEPFRKKENNDFGSGSEKKQVAIRRIFTPKFKVKDVPSSIDFNPGPAPQAKEISSPEADLAKSLEMKINWKATSRAASSYKFPPLEILEKDKGGATAGDVKINSAIIKRTLQNFDIQVEVSEVNFGPTVTQYALKPAEGVKLSKITVLSNDLSMALASHPIRIEAPIPGRPLVGIEVPNKTRAIVRLRNMVEHSNFQNAVSSLAFCLGRDVAGNPVFADLGKMPHLLVAGATGTGKTICLNTIILSLLYGNSPEDLRLILVDPKRVEFSIYDQIPHLLCPVIHNSQKAVNALKWLIGEMERRFEVLSEAKSRDINEYNKVYHNNLDSMERLPYIVLIVDELADLMAARGKEMEAGIVRLAQMARAVGIHLILATQRPSVEVITGLIKANVTSRITFQVASQVDSRTVIDTSGAEKLLGFGDLLFISAEIVKPKRIQGVFVSEKEVKKVIEYIVTNNKEEERGDISTEMENSNFQSLTGALEAQGDGFSEGDPLYEEAKKVVIESRKASASLLQRRLRVGYARAARLVDMLEEKGIVGPGEGAKPREVYTGSEEPEN